MGTSASFGSKKRPAGKQWRSSSSKEIFDNLYKNVDSAFTALEAAVNAGWAACEAATVGNVTLSAASEVQDGVTLQAGNRVLVRNQTLSQNNGIYVVGTIANNVAPLTRATDLDVTSEVQVGDAVWVKGGTLYGNSVFRVTSAPAALGTNPLIFSLSSKAAAEVSSADYINPYTKSGFAIFDATAGKAIGTHAFGPTLPKGAVIVKAWWRTTTSFASSGNTATVALGINQTAGATGIKGATIVTDGAYVAPSLNDGLPDFAAANYVNATTGDATQFRATVATQALTAGKLELHFVYDIIA